MSIGVEESLMLIGVEESLMLIGVEESLRYRRRRKPSVQASKKAFGTGVEESLLLCNNVMRSSYKYNFSFDYIKLVSLLMQRHQTAELFDQLSKGRDHFM
jgi:hypothetical protein